MKKIGPYIEALIFAVKEPISQHQIVQTIQDELEYKLTASEFEEIISSIKEKYQTDSFAFQVIEISGGYLFSTKPAFNSVLNVHLKIESKRKLSKAAMETLAIIAYKQPVTKSEIEQIRGVNCDYTVNKMLEKSFVEVLGRSDGPGRPLLYGTTAFFLDHLGLKATSDLPKLKEFENEEDSIGTQAPIELEKLQAN